MQQKPGETVRDYEKPWKDLLSQLDYVIDEQLLIQWLLAGLSQKVRRHISLETFKTYEDTQTKALQVEMDEDIPAYPTDHRLEEQLKNVQKSLKELTLKNRISGVPTARRPVIQKIIVDNNIANKMSALYKPKYFATFARNTEIILRNIVRLT